MSQTKNRFQIIFIGRGPCTGDLLSSFILSWLPLKYQPSKCFGFNNVSKTNVCMLEMGPEKCAADSKATFKDDETLLQMHVSTRSKLKKCNSRDQSECRKITFCLNSRGGKLPLFVCPGVGIGTSWSCKTNSRGVRCGVDGEVGAC